MTRRIEFGALAVVGCLCLAVGSVACTPAGGNPDGSVKDAGPKDGGPPDSGPQNTLDAHAIGGKCLDSSQEAQSNCDTGLVCLDISDLNMCSAFCSQDSDCSSTTNGQSAICWSGICVPGCNSSASDPCNRTDFVCLADFSQEGSICLPDCTQQSADFCNSFFGYPISACAADGSCAEEADCSSSACPSGQQCDTYTVEGQTQNVCTQDCTTAGTASCTTNDDCTLGACDSNTCDACPYGFTCDSANTKVCQPTPVGNYAPCLSTAQCPSGTSNNVMYSQECEAFIEPSQEPTAGAPEDQICLTASCGSDTDCLAVPGGTGQTCVQAFGICLLPCTTGDAGTACPTGTSCIELSDSNTYCAPSGLE